MQKGKGMNAAAGNEIGGQGLDCWLSLRGKTGGAGISNKFVE